MHWLPAAARRAVPDDEGEASRAGGEVTEFLYELLMLVCLWLGSFIACHPLQRPVSRTAAFNSLSTLEISRYRQRGTSISRSEDTRVYAAGNGSASPDALNPTTHRGK